MLVLEEFETKTQRIYFSGLFRDSVTRVTYQIRSKDTRALACPQISRRIA